MLTLQDPLLGMCALPISRQHSLKEEEVKRSVAKDLFSRRKKQQKGARAPNPLTSNLNTYHPTVSTVGTVHIQTRKRKERIARTFARMDRRISLPGILVQSGRYGDEEKKKEQKGERKGKEAMRERQMGQGK